jgi:tetratricopeptide (TPR) repeat protein
MSPAWRPVLALCAWMVTWGLCGDALAGSYAGANRAYQDARYTEAISGYEALIATGVVHEHLYYNLGNAYFRAGDLGRAAYNYERALRLDPGFDDARHNLAVVRETVAETTGASLGEPAEPTAWSRAFTAVSKAWLITTFIITNLGFFAGLIALRIRSAKPRRRRLRVATGLAGAVFAMSAIWLLGRIAIVDRVDLGVVLPAEVAMREGPSSAERSYVHAGARVRIIGHASGWLKVRLESGTEGWVPQNAIGQL